MEATSQAAVRKARFARLGAELASLRDGVVGLKKRADDAIKAAAKRRDDALLEHTRKEHLN